MQSACEQVAVFGSAISRAHQGMSIFEIVVVVVVMGDCKDCIQFWRACCHAHMIVDRDRDIAVHLFPAMIVDAVAIALGKVVQHAASA